MLATLTTLCALTIALLLKERLVENSITTAKSLTESIKVCPGERSSARRERRSPGAACRETVTAAGHGMGPDGMVNQPCHAVPQGWFGSVGLPAKFFHLTWECCLEMRCPQH